MNLATRDELLVIPGIDGPKADEILGARGRGKLTSLAAFQLPTEAAARLTTDGVTTLRRIRALPLEIYSAAPVSATR